MKTDNDKINVTLTLCYYEYPAALHDIKAWEDLKFSEILYKRISESLSYPRGEKMRSYIVDLTNKKYINYDYEFLIAIDIDKDHGEDEEAEFIMKEIEGLSEELLIKIATERETSGVDVKFYKSIFFGRIDHNYLSTLQLKIDHLIDSLNKKYN